MYFSTQFLSSILYISVPSGNTSTSSGSPFPFVSTITSAFSWLESVFFSFGEVQEITATATKATGSTNRAFIRAHGLVCLFIIIIIRFLVEQLLKLLVIVLNFTPTASSKRRSWYWRASNPWRRVSLSASNSWMASSSRLRSQAAGLNHCAVAQSCTKSRSHE